MTAEQYELVVARSAARSLRENLPETIASAVIEFITGPLIENPHRVGKRLRNELGGYWSARRGTYRVIYQIKEDQREVVVTFIGHRRNAYRTR